MDRQPGSWALGQQNNPSSSRAKWLRFFLVVLLSLPSAAQAQAKPASQAEVCEVDTTTPPYSNPWTCANTTKTVFWAPNCLSGALTAKVPDGAEVFVVYNQLAPRTLNVIGRDGKDILVGSPTANNVLRGMAGPNTYVLGGRNAYLLSGADRVFPVSSSRETDRVILTSEEADFIHIDAENQLTGGTILVAGSPPGDPHRLQFVRGSGDLARFGFASCPQAWLPRFRFSPPPLLAAATGFDLARVPLDPTRPDCLRDSRAGETDSAGDAPPVADDIPVPGVPTLEGFALKPKDLDRLVLPAEDYVFMGHSLAEKELIPILVVRGIPFERARLLPRGDLKPVMAQAKGLQNVRSAEAPLVYFQDHGLLVFSRNALPLGSRANPGQVIARLLDAHGRPLVLPVRPRRPLYPARFVLFEPRQQDRAARQPVDDSPDPLR